MGKFLIWLLRYKIKAFSILPVITQLLQPGLEAVQGSIFGRSFLFRVPMLSRRLCGFLLRVFRVSSSSPKTIQVKQKMLTIVLRVIVTCVLNNMWM